MREFAAEKTQKLSKCIAGELSFLPYYYVKKLIAEKQVKVDGKRTGIDGVIQAGSIICAYYDEKKFKPYDLIYEDENIVAIDKSAGISSEKLFELVSEQYSSLKFIHRLDTNTSGIIIFAKNSTAESELIKAFRENRANKRYVCRVYGRFDKKEDVLTAYLIKDALKGEVSVVGKKSAGACAIKTGYRVLSECEDGTSILEIRLFSGKTHQIRAHMRYTGHFIIGDGKYGDGRINKLYGESKQNLRSVKIAFEFAPSSALSYLSEKEFSVKEPIKYKK